VLRCAAIPFAAFSVTFLLEKPMIIWAVFEFAAKDLAA
jgi:hypothetical protein